MLTDSIFLASDLIPFTICSFRSWLGFLAHVAYWRMTAELMPISLDTPATLMKS